MLKKFSKLLLLVLVVFVVSSSSFICLADETHNHTDDEYSTMQNTEEIHNGDLYLFDNDVIMDKLVYGNVFIFGNNVKVTGEVHGNVFIFANNVTFEECFVRYSIFVCANSVYYNGYCGSELDYGNLYVAARSFESTYYSYTTGDLNAICSNILLKSGIYRDAHLISNNIDLGEGTDIPIVYGTLNYISNKELDIPDGVLTPDSSINYTPSLDISNIILNFATCITSVLALYIILSKVAPNFMQKVYSQNFSALGLLKAFGIGLSTIFIVLIFFILLLGTVVGTILAIILALLFAILYLIASPIFAISITDKLKSNFKLEKTYMFYLILSLISIVLYGVTYIPFVGILIGFVITTTSIGFIINTYIPQKALTEEEKLAIAEKKAEAKEDKLKRKQEKDEDKQIKKQAKLEAKQIKKQQNLENKIANNKEKPKANKTKKLKSKKKDK